MTRILLVAVIAIFVSSEHLVAQTQSGSSGRFFQKLREDIFGSSGAEKPAPQPSQQLQQQLQRIQQQQSRTQQPGRTPTPLRSSQTQPSRTPTPLNSAVGTNNNKLPYSNKTRSSQASSQARMYSPYTDSNGKSGSGYDYRKPATAQTRKVSTGNGRDFGFSVKANDKDQLFVSSVVSSGNAAQEGIRRGDQILEIGGIEATSVDEFDEIAKIMSPGDQMEFKIRRGGRNQTLNIQFGVMPEPEQLQKVTSGGNPSAGSSSRSYDFAPPRDSKSGSSVLSSRSSSAGSFNQASTRKISETSARQIQQLNQTIVNQHRKIQDLQKEIQQLKQGYRSR